MTCLKSLIQSHKGQYLGVTFMKKSGELRTLNGQHCYKQGHDGVRSIWNQQIKTGTIRYSEKK